MKDVQLCVVVPGVVVRVGHPRVALGFGQVVREGRVADGVGARDLEVWIGGEVVVRVVEAIEYHLQVGVGEVAAVL